MTKLESELLLRWQELDDKVKAVLRHCLTTLDQHRPITREDLQQIVQIITNQD